MRIVNREEFLKLPQGTLYQQAETPYAFEGLRVKYETWGNDFQTSNFDLPDNDSSEQLFDRLNDMLENGASYPMEIDGVGRDGLFMQEAIFLVYERDDVVKIRDFLNQILEP